MVAFMREEHNNNYVPDARLTHVLFLVEMEEAGMRIEKNDISYYEWKLLAEYKYALKDLQNKKIESRIKR